MTGWEQKKAGRHEGGAAPPFFKRKIGNPMSGFEIVGYRCSYANPFLGRRVGIAGLAREMFL